MRPLFAAGLIGLALAPAAQAQTAADINRLNAAIQVCNSPMGAGMAECGKLRGQLGMGAPRAASPGISPGVGAAASGLGGLLGAALAARVAPAPMAPPPPSAPGPVVRGDGQISMIGGGSFGAAAPSPSGAASTYVAGQTYQSCVAARGGDWQPCLPLLKNSQPR